MHMTPSELDQQFGPELAQTGFEEWGRLTRGFLGRVNERGPGLLTDMVLRALSQPDLRAKCEQHQLLDYLVLHDDPRSGIRIRLHIATEDHLQRVHDHRFTFSSLILCGRYEHTLFRARSDLYQVTPEQAAKAYQDRHHCDPAFRGNSQDDLFEAMLQRDEKAGTTFTLKHDVPHTVLTTKGTVSLVVRGPAQKPRSYIFDQLEQGLWWRFGRENETAQRASQKWMPEQKVDAVLRDLCGMGVLSAQRCGELGRQLA
jgi:hypothetical protein